MENHHQHVLRLGLEFKILGLESWISNLALEVLVLGLSIWVEGLGLAF